MSKPVVSVSNVLTARPVSSIEVDFGTSIQDLAPSVNGYLVCRINGGPDYVHRDDWAAYLVNENDLIEFIEYPQAEYLLYIVIGMLVASAYMISRIRKPDINDVKSEQVSNTSLSGNRPKPDAPIPVICGRAPIQPPFAGMPYSEYDEFGTQFYYALLVVGAGYHDIENDLIDDTPITHFKDVLIHQYLPPGVGPSIVQANVLTASEVSGQEMLTGQYIGGITACGAAFKVVAIGIDVVAPRGLAHQNDNGSMGNLSVSWIVAYRTIDDFGAPTSNWINIATETRTSNKISPLRWTTKYTLLTPARIQVRIHRTDLKSDSSRDSHDLIWDGLRAYLYNPAPLNPNVAHYEVVLRSSEQLNQVTQRSILLIVRAHCRPLNSDLSWLPRIYTRNPSWWILELATSSVWGLGMSDDVIDLQSFYEFGQTCDQRQDRFDYELNSTTDAWEAMQLIASVGRAKVFRRHGILSIARDELASLPVTALTSRNTIPGSMVTEELMATTDMPDGYVVEYLNNRTWLWTSINCPCDGITTMNKPVIVKLPGITGSKHAEREGKYLAARLQYRRRQVSCTTEMQGLLPSYLSPVRWMPEVYGYGQSGDVLSWDPDRLAMTLSEPPKWGLTNYLTLIRDDGSLTTPVPVTIGLNDHEVILPTPPDFTIVCNDMSRERPKFLFGRMTHSDELVRVTSIVDGGGDDGVQLLTIGGEIDDERVHTADNLLLPIPGEIQDDIIPYNSDDSGGDDGSGPSSTYIVTLHDRNINVFVNVSAPTSPYISLKNNGRATVSDLYATEITLTNQWLSSAVDTSVTVLYEARCTVTYGVVSGSPINEWLNLSESRTWYSSDAIIMIEIRLASNSVMQDQAYFTLTSEYVGDGA